MQLSGEERSIFSTACGNQDNLAAQDLLNVFAASTPNQVLAQVAGAPRSLRDELERYIQQAIAEEKRRHRPN
jgi:hypothetical protein